jgi:hypothetical protein
MKSDWNRLLRVLCWVAGLALLFAVYTSGLSWNPPGFYLDESCTAYNAYLLAHTGAGELGPHFPLFFEVYRGEYVQYYHPVEEYLLALVFLFLPPSILLVRIYDAFVMFAACLLLGLLAWRISGRRLIGVIVAAVALATPWLFEVGRLGWEVHLVPLLTVLFLHALYRVHGKDKWSLLDITLLVSTLALLTYCYASGRMLGPLMAAGLVFFATTRRRILAVAATWVLYGVTLIPVVLFSQKHPGVLVKRFLEVSYLRTTIPFRDNASQFIRRFLEDQSLTGLLLTGDEHARHHVQGSGGAFFFSAFILVLIGLVIVIACRRCEPWWRFVLYGLAAAIVPGAITTWPFHFLRLVAYPVFLLLLAVPGLEWLLAHERTSALPPSSFAAQKRPWKDRCATGFEISEGILPRFARLLILYSLLALAIVETYSFQRVFRRDGPKREGEFDHDYKKAYDAAVEQPARPIYLEDGRWGPAYIHALWYAALEKRPRSQFAILEPGTKPPRGAVVISTGDTCDQCETIKRAYIFYVYKAP